MVHTLAASSLHPALKSFRYSEKKENPDKTSNSTWSFSQAQYKESVEKRRESSGQGPIEHTDRHSCVAWSNHQQRVKP